jgi:hypothetical protein
LFFTVLKLNLCTVDAVLPNLVFADGQIRPLFSAQADLLSSVYTPAGRRPESAYMNDGPLGRVFDGAAKDFMGEWGGIALAEKDEPHYFHKRVFVSSSLYRDDHGLCTE